MVHDLGPDAMASLIFGRAEQEPEPDRPKRVLVYGDLLSWGWVPQRTFIPSQQFPPDRQWPKVMGTALGPGYEGVVDAMSGRTTDADDPLAPQIPGVGTNGNECLPATLARPSTARARGADAGCQRLQAAVRTWRAADRAGRRPADRDGTTLGELFRHAVAEQSCAASAAGLPAIVRLVRARRGQARSSAPRSAPTAWRLRSRMLRQRLALRSSMRGRSSSAMASMACI